MKENFHEPISRTPYPFLKSYTSHMELSDLERMKTAFEKEIARLREDMSSGANGNIRSNLEKMIFARDYKSLLKKKSLLEKKLSSADITPEEKNTFFHNLVMIDMSLSERDADRALWRKEEESHPKKLSKDIAIYEQAARFIETVIENGSYHQSSKDS